MLPAGFVAGREDRSVPEIDAQADALVDAECHAGAHADGHARFNANVRCDPDAIIDANAIRSADAGSDLDVARGGRTGRDGDADVEQLRRRANVRRRRGPAAMLRPGIRPPGTMLRGRLWAERQWRVLSGEPSDLGRRLLRRRAGRRRPGEQSVPACDDSDRIDLAERTMLRARLYPARQRRLLPGRSGDRDRNLLPGGRES